MGLKTWLLGVRDRLRPKPPDIKVSLDPFGWIKMETVKDAESTEGLECIYDSLYDLHEKLDRIEKLLEDVLKGGWLIEHGGRMYHVAYKEMKE